MSRGKYRKSSELRSPQTAEPGVSGLGGSAVAGAEPQVGTAEGRRSCPTPQSAPVSPSPPAALPRASPAPPDLGRAVQLHQPWVEPGAPPRRQVESGAWRLGRAAGTCSGPPLWGQCQGGPSVPRVPREAYLGCRRTCPRPAGWRLRRPWQRGARVLSAVAARPTPHAALAAPVRARCSLLEAEATGSQALQLKDQLPPRGAAFWDASSRSAPSEELWAGPRPSSRPCLC